jgi:hypothetical protein
MKAIMYMFSARMKEKAGSSCVLWLSVDVKAVAVRMQHCRNTGGLRHSGALDGWTN